MGMIGIQTLEKDSSLNSAMDARVVSENLKDKADPPGRRRFFSTDCFGNRMEWVELGEG